MYSAFNAIQKQTPLNLNDWGHDEFFLRPKISQQLCSPKVDCYLSNTVFGNRNSPKILAVFEIY